MEQIRKQVNRQATRGDMEDRIEGVTGVETTQRRGQGFGIEILDLRIVRADLPPDISQATYERMRKNFIPVDLLCEHWVARDIKLIIPVGEAIAQHRGEGDPGDDSCSEGPEERIVIEAGWF